MRATIVSRLEFSFAAFAIMLAAQLQAPTQAAICARRRWLIGSQRPAESLIRWATPDFPQGLLGSVAERVILVSPLGKWRDAARQCTPIGSDVHDGPRPTAQRPRGGTVAALKTYTWLGGGAGGAEGDTEG